MRTRVGSMRCVVRSDGACGSCIGAQYGAHQLAVCTIQADTCTCKMGTKMKSRRPGLNRGPSPPFEDSLRKSPESDTLPLRYASLDRVFGSSDLRLAIATYTRCQSASQPLTLFPARLAAMYARLGAWDDISSFPYSYTACRPHQGQFAGHVRLPGGQQICALPLCPCHKCEPVDGGCGNEGCPREERRGRLQVQW